MQQMNFQISIPVLYASDYNVMMLVKHYMLMKENTMMIVSCRKSAAAAND